MIRISYIIPLSGSQDTAQIPSERTRVGNIFNTNRQKLIIYRSTDDGESTMIVMTGIAKFSDLDDSTKELLKIQTDSTNPLLINGVAPPSDGTYTPTLTNVTNVTASTAYQCQYFRVGNTVTVSGKVDIDPTAAGSSQFTELGMSLPIASNFSAEENLGGCAGCDTVSFETAARIKADAANNRAAFVFQALNAGNLSFGFSFTYLVI